MNKNQDSNTNFLTIIHISLNLLFIFILTQEHFFIGAGKVLTAFFIMSILCMFFSFYIGSINCEPSKRNDILIHILNNISNVLLVSGILIILIGIIGIIGK